MGVEWIVHSSSRRSNVGAQDDDVTSAWDDEFILYRCTLRFVQFSSYVGPQKYVPLIRYLDRIYLLSWNIPFLVIIYVNYLQQQ